MTRAYFILMVLFGIFSQAVAQRSAGAKMDVSVRVVAGVTASAGEGAQLAVDPDQKVHGELGSVTLIGSNEEDVLISTASSISLVDGDGNQIKLPLRIKREARDGAIHYSFITVPDPESDSVGKAEGKYKGTLTTTVEYQ